MKQIIILLLILDIMVCLWASETPIKPESTVYPATLYAVSVDGDRITAIDFRGDMWEFSAKGNFLPGDLFAAMMDDNGTEDTEDDLIISVKWAGYIDGTFETA